MERSLAHIETVAWIKPIAGADNIELIGVLGWTCIAKKEEFKVGDRCVYIEIDSLVPESDERFEFLSNKKFKIKTMKLGKFSVISQGLAMPADLFPEVDGIPIGGDVTDILNITYYSADDRQRKSKDSNPDMKYKAMAARRPELFKKPIIRKIMKHKLGRAILFMLFGNSKDKPKAFPDWIVKTDEVRIENRPDLLDPSNTWIQTEKMDGTSVTLAIDRIKKDKFDFIVCSRNVRQMDPLQETYFDSNIYWELADKYDVKNKLIDFANKHGYDRVVLQGEGIGSPQGNQYQLKENELLVFNLIIDGERMSTLEMKNICKEYGFTTVPIINTDYHTPETMEEIKIEADGKSVFNPNVAREGFVYRSLDGKQSFKNVSRSYLLKER